MTASLRVGIDVGGTNTDAAVLQPDDAILATAKRPTTPDVTGGILDALDTILAADGVDRDAVEAVMLGTTHCTNALAERDGLHEIGVLRVGAPATQCIPPLIEWPDDLAAATGNHVALVRGGHEFDGRELVPLDTSAVWAAAETFEDAGVDAVAVTAVFSPVRADHEERAAEIVAEVVGDAVPVSRSHEIGSVGLLDRENATALNAALTGVAHEAANAFLDAMDIRDLDTRLYFGQNDGTLMDVEYALKYPIFTVASGPSNSVRGAAALSGVEDGIIVDVGGTTTDVGAVANGFPRESTAAVEIGEVATNFRMPDLISIGIGGGSIVAVNGSVSVGPESVGYDLVDRARCFGGDVLTATDIAVAAGDADIGTVPPDGDPATVRTAREQIHERIAEAVDRMKTGPSPGSGARPRLLDGSSGRSRSPGRWDHTSWKTSNWGRVPTCRTCLRRRLQTRSRRYPSRPLAPRCANWPGQSETAGWSRSAPRRRWWPRSGRPWSTGSTGAMSRSTRTRSTSRRSSSPPTASRTGCASSQPGPSPLTTARPSSRAGSTRIPQRRSRRPSRRTGSRTPPTG